MYAPPVARPTLADLVRAHERWSKAPALRRSFGDGFLYAHSTIHRNVRDAVVARGYLFTREDFCDYRALSLTALPAILRRKQIPYLDNATPLVRIEERCPRVFDVETMLVPAKNCLLHESTHCLADATFARLPGERGIVLRAILGEALANTAERISNYETRGGVHRWFHNLSSFQEASPRPRREPLRRALQALPPKVVFKALFFSFMHASFLYKRLGREELARVKDHIGGEARHVLPLFREGLGLSIDFRVRTQELYFRFHHRLDRSIFELTDFDFVEELERHPRVLAEVDALAELLTSPTPRTPAAHRLAGSS